MNIQKLLQKKIKQSFLRNKIPKHFNPIIQCVTNKLNVHYQINGIIQIANILKKNPSELAKNIINMSELKKICSKITVSHPGFINLTLNVQWIQENLEKSYKCFRLNISYTNPKTVIIDYSSPNVAKEMHVGHLRSTIIGDSTARILEFLGDKVIRTNHIGDWGTQFGMLIAYLQNKKKDHVLKNISLEKLEKYYKKAKLKFNEEKSFLKKSKKTVVLLQSGNSYITKIWKTLVDITIKENQSIYDQLGVSLKKQHILGESFYNKLLPSIINDLLKRKIAVIKKGSVIIFLKELKNKLGDDMGVIMQKSDGAFLYISTDVACLKYRFNDLKADRIIYYVDSRQKQHFQQIEIICKKSGYIPNNFNIEHHIFGMMLSNDNKPFKTRSGKNIKLTKLIHESIERAKVIIKQKNPNLLGKKLDKTAHVIGIGALKYADLSKNRKMNYVFNWNNMLRFEGNTALYIQYAYTRILSIFKKNKIYPFNLKNDIILLENQEIILGIQLLQFEEILYSASKNGIPNIICSYLYRLSVSFSHFYENYPIFSENKIHIKYSRLKLSALIAKTIKIGLSLLGIETVDYM
ncbi:arginine--tRNA ligase [Buchnera aphidicola]|uniref:Arginine--tRNA ligase n=1 Tax=Buchnera aphidicola (Anoecia oenotherae) TaxID=1241833 RepID=A0A4D6XV06_9GAMM|nr:arginine--tRNA ligase [Buchnera aphidicola]QCI19319.1 arginine--tRNA ligase [Buchnera aphidicola (Anoecia oenotherae)]